MVRQKDIERRQIQCYLIFIHSKSLKFLILSSKLHFTQVILEVEYKVSLPLNEDSFCLMLSGKWFLEINIKLYTGNCTKAMTVYHNDRCHFKSHTFNKNALNALFLTLNVNGRKLHITSRKCIAGIVVLNLNNCSIYRSGLGTKAAYNDYNENYPDR